MLPAGFEPAIPASERPQAYALDRAATGIEAMYLEKQAYYTPIGFLEFETPRFRDIRYVKVVRLSAVHIGRLRMDRYGPKHVELTPEY